MCYIKEMFNRLKNKWRIRSNFQFWLIFIIFGITGSSMIVIKPFVFDLLGVDNTLNNLIYFIIYLVVITPVYFVTLLIIGTLLGQGKFFLSFVKKFVSRFGVLKKIFSL